MNSVKRLAGLSVLLIIAALAPATASAQIFLEYGAIKGDATDPDYVDKIEIASFSWGLVRPVTFSGGTGGPQAGRPTSLEVLLTKDLDNSSAALAMELLAGTGDKKVVIRFASPGDGKLQEYLALELCKAFITSLSTSAGEDGTPMETVTLTMAAFGMKYTTYDAAGKQDVTQVVQWDFELAKTGSCGPP
jgi:type VI secretion system secreted protein Hcp